MTALSYIYRFLANFAFLAVVYFSLNFLTQYQQRTIIAFLVLVYTAMRDTRHASAMGRHE